MRVKWPFWPTVNGGGLYWWWLFTVAHIKYQQHAIWAKGAYAAKFIICFHTYYYIPFHLLAGSCTNTCYTPFSWQSWPRTSIIKLKTPVIVVGVVFLLLGRPSDPFLPLVLVGSRVTHRFKAPFRLLGSQLTVVRENAESRLSAHKNRLVIM